jgi:hypothetical protein
MITKTAKAMSKCALIGTSAKRFGVEGKNISGATIYITRLANTNMIVSFSMSESSTGISVGNGTSQESDDYYKLENTITSGLSLVGSISEVVDEGTDENGNIQTMFVITFRNTKSTSITITEIGYKSSVYAVTGTNGGSATQQTILTDRTLLDNPITIQPNETGTIQYVLKLVDSV